LDGRPTWDVNKAPAIIGKQMESIRKLEATEKAKPAVDEGIIKRLENALDFYDNLLKEINNQREKKNNAGGNDDEKIILTSTKSLDEKNSVK
jgi:hypothetical protein